MDDVARENSATSAVGAGLPAIGRDLSRASPFLRHLQPREIGLEVELADKPGSVVGSHSSGTMVTHRLKQPTRRLRRAADVNDAMAIDAPAYLALLRVGFTLPSVLPRPR